MSSCCDNNKYPESAFASLNTKKTVALVGNPNCGKTTLFNALTGARQRVGNWPGVTVERKSGYFTQQNETVEVVDLPGIYSLALGSSGAVDERIACEFILERRADVVINIVDASHLERHLYLTTQLIEMGAPVLLVLNMIDVARSQKINVDLAKLSAKLGCPVVALSATKAVGLQELKHAILHFKEGELVSPLYPDALEKAVLALTAVLEKDPEHIYLPELKQNPILLRWLAIRLLENDAFVQNYAGPHLIAEAQVKQAEVTSLLAEDVDILLADSRYQLVQRTVDASVSRESGECKSWTSQIDNFVLNRILGVPVFLGVMYLLFFFAINIGGAFQDFFDISSQTLFVDGFAYLLTQLGSPAWLTVLLANGIGKGINTTITFIPVIGAMFLFLSLLEDSGYMARAAFVIDRFMRVLGLPGKAFVPMIVGFGCNVPAVMGARTLENKRDRILTIMMAPFMSCGARLAIYAVFTAAFFPHGGQNIVFALYIIGILMAVLTGFILRHTLLKGDPSPLVMELPAYHVPHLKTLLLHAWQRLQGFVFRAGKLIVPICILIGTLNSFNLDGTINAGEADTHSLLSLLGQWMTPLFTPMGISANNWPATVGLLTGVLAKEVVVGTLNTLYTQMGHFVPGAAAGFSVWGGLQQAFQSIPHNLSQLGSAFANPVLAQAPMGTVNQGVYGLMYQQFDGQVGAFAYLLFVLLYFPCVSTTAAMLRELHRGWAIFSAIWMAGIAYGAAVFFYQAATLSRHPFSSLMWIIGILTTFFGTIAFIRWYANREWIRINNGLPKGEPA